MRFAILGRLVVTDGDREIDPGPPRNRAVLAHLLVEADRVVDVDVLIDQVWRGAPTPGTTASVHVTMSRLRKQLRPADGSPSPIVTQAPGYRLAVARDDVDALRFTDLVDGARTLAAEGATERARHQLDEALSLWRGQPLADVRSEVVQAEAARLSAHWLAAVELGAELDLLLGRHAELADRLALVAAAHPLREGLQGSLITALYRHGRQSEALELYERTRRVLAEELGVDPGPELQRLYARVLRHDPSLAWTPEPAARPVVVDPAPAPATASGGGSRPAAPLVGRLPERRRAAAALDRAASGETAGLALFGESGIGKTRLTEEVADLAAQRGFDVVWSRCQDGGGTPAFWPWSQALEGLTAVRGRPRVAAATEGRGRAAAALLPGPDAGPAVGLAQHQRVVLFDAVAAVLSDLARERPVCLVLEDLQWADADSVDLLDYLLAATHEVPLLVVVTVRDPDESPLSEGRRVLASVTRQAHVERVQLSGLDPAAVQEICAARLGRPVTEEAARRLHRRTSGNPFFLGELVRLLADEGIDRQRAVTEVPASVQAVLERRYRHLDSSTRELLSAAAVVGRTVDVGVLGEVVERSPLALADDLDRAVTAGVLVPHPDGPGTWSFTHALVQEALLAATGPMRRAALHARVAEVLERRLGDAPDAAPALAYHHRSAGAVGDPEKAARFSLVAAASARRRAAPREAERHCRDALAVLVGRSGPGVAQLEREARRQLAGLLTMTLGYDTSAQAIHRTRTQGLVEGPPAAPDGARDDDQADARPKMTGGVAVALAANDLPAAELLVSEMEQAAERWDDTTLRLSADHARGQVLVLRGRLRAGMDQFTAAVRLLDDDAGDVDFSLFIQNPRASAPAWQAMALSLLGDVGAGDAAAERAFAAARAADDRYTTAMIHYLESWRALFLQRPERSLVCATTAVAMAEELLLPKLAALVRHPQGAATARLGQVEEGLATILDAHATLQQVAPGDLLSHLLLGMIAEVEALAGRDDDADRTALRALSEGRRTGERVYQPAVHLLRAQIARRRGEPAAVVRETLMAGLAVAADQEAELFAERLRTELAALDDA
ncbi:AAA family ATPase [Modestobacter sp. I12A-02628]|uniref:AAA family ATPase n=1 Tax=Goekera deserti TaxID=2497753 RepID=A0A7K3WK61_9ACTN|nr:AfsR/SARP family transcriptional regulator [Goekera deserti]MPQ99059.1 AAA family ATPase [Goekera deserti]NDI47393.1 AAA family ATPase [Goekera deserti]NEL55923.1 AAA family ATPase [Goekera deserti]